MIMRAIEMAPMGKWKQIAGVAASRGAHATGAETSVLQSPPHRDQKTVEDTRSECKE